MAFTITVFHGPPVLIVEGAGPASMADLCSFMDLVAAVAARTNQTRVLMNLTNVEIDLSFTEHLSLGSHAAEKLRGMERVASVVSELNRKGTSEKAAQKMGLRLRTFTSLDEGMQWLTQG
ncbi:MAG: hypothetical protein JWQ07_3649 [Ramlibacter sp.]|nr:hypothetical protein [Ramlibacter sp.]